MGEANLSVSPAAYPHSEIAPAFDRRINSESAPRPDSRLVFLVTDAFYGHGGIAKFNRDLLRAACSYSTGTEVVAYPRVLSCHEREDLPRTLRYETGVVSNKLTYIGRVLIDTLRGRHWDLVVCGHINLLPIAWMISRLARAPLILIIHGIDAWKPTRRFWTDILVRYVSIFVAVSETSKRRFSSWSCARPERGFVLPNCVDLTRFSPQPKNRTLESRYRLQGKTVLLTLGRLAAFDRYKGFDEVLDVLPSLVGEIPNVVYLIAGEGPDRQRLEQKARSLSMADRVVFTGLVSESEKSDLYSLADAFVMPSRGEGFGIVLLEAMACGIPVVASLLDGGRDALLHGELGTLVDPTDLSDVRRGIVEALRLPKRVPHRLEHFSVQNYERRVHLLLDHALRTV